MSASVQFGFEVLNLYNGGADYVMGPSGAATQVESLQIRISLACSGGNSKTPNVAETGFAQALCYGFFTSSKPTFSANSTASFNAPANADWGGWSTDNPNGFAVGGNGPVGGGFSNPGVWPAFATILKAWFPQPNSWDAVIQFPGDFTIPAGSYFVLHVDHTGYQADLEMQGTIWYG